MIENINNRQVSNILNESSSKRPDSANSPIDKDLAASLEVRTQPLIELAIQNPTQDTSAVQRAKQLLASNQLETQKNIKAAAEEILKFGI